MRFFGHFLLDKGLIDETTLLASLVEQNENLPSICAVIHSLNLLNPKQQLEVIAYQVEHQVEYRQACVQLNYWSSEIEERILHELRSKVKPLGHILINRQALTIDKLNSALSDFVSEAPELRREPVEATRNRLRHQQEKKVSPLLQQVYCTAFDQSLYERLRQLKGPDACLQRLHFMANYCGAKKSAELIANLMSNLENNFNPEDLQNRLSALWSLREQLHAGNQEDDL